MPSSRFRPYWLSMHVLGHGRFTSPIQLAHALPKTTTISRPLFVCKDAGDLAAPLVRSEARGCPETLWQAGVRVQAINVVRF